MQNILVALLARTIESIGVPHKKNEEGYEGKTRSYLSQVLGKWMEEYRNEGVKMIVPHI